MNENWSEGKTWWLIHNNSFFGFSEPAEFVTHKDGGYFASQATKQQIHATIYQGLKRPRMQ